MPTVIVPSAWAERSVNTFSVGGDTVEEVISRFAEDEPALGARIVDASGAVHRYLSFYVNDERVRLSDFGACDLTESDVVVVVPPMAGG